MNVRITPRDAPNRTDLYGSVARVRSDGQALLVTDTFGATLRFPLKTIAEIALDEDPGDWW